MWPFDKILVNKCKLLEQTNEALLGKNFILERELERSQQKEQELLGKLFEMTGINQRVNISQQTTESRKPIRIGDKIIGWNQVKKNLEAEAAKEISEREQYWKDKQSKVDKGIEDLERQILAGDGKNAS